MTFTDPDPTEPVTAEPVTAEQPPNPPPPPRTGWTNTPVSRIPRDDPDREHRGRVGGVVAGLSHAYGFDLRTTRIATVIAMIVLPVLVLVYVAAWVLLPPDRSQAAPIGAVLSDRRRLPLLVTIGLVLLVGSLGSFGAWFLFRGAPWGLALIGLGVLLWVSTGSRNGSPAAAPGAQGTPTEPWHVRGASPTADTPTADALTTEHLTDGTLTAGTPVAAAPRRRRWPIASAGVVLALLWAGTAAVVEAAGGWNAPALWVIVSAFGVVAAGLAVSALVNLRWWPILPLLPVAGLIVMLAVAQPRLDGPSGERTIVPLTLADAEKVQHVAAGELEIDLRLLPAGSGDLTITAEVGIGRLHLIVPADANLQLDTSVGAGVLQVDDIDLVSGMRNEDDRLVPAKDAPATATITLDLRVGMGQIDIDREG